MSDRLPLRGTGGCPVLHTDYRVQRPAFETWALLNEEREQAEVAWNDSAARGFWVLNRYEDVADALGRPEDLTNDSVTVFLADDPGTMLPQNLNPPEHAKLRRVLNPFFAPSAVRRMSEIARERAAALVEEIAAQGSTEVTSGFALLYPTEIFLALLGLPVEDGAELLPAVEDMFLGFFREDEESRAKAIPANYRIRDYFKAAVAEREAQLRDPETDLVSRLLTVEIDGEKLSRRDVVVICTTMMAAGLDTTRAALGYIFQHLATHPELRARLVAEPELWPQAIEEAVRLFGLVIQDGRVAARDMEWKGAPISKGDKVWLGLAAANRDPRKFADPDVFDIDRPGLKQHLGFGIGQHRCIGIHLARAELVIALEEWHKRIPDYRVAEGAELVERGGQLRLESLPLEWDVS